MTLHEAGHAPRVSVIVPAYNAAAFLPEAIDSVLGQTFTDWELVLVDDGSTDATPQVVASFQDGRIRYIRQENRGRPAARNAGIKQARGDYLSFLDADDAYLPAKLEVQVAHLDGDPDVGFSYASRIEVDSELRPTWLLRSPPRVTLRDLILGFPFSINDILLRRGWLDRVGGFDESFRLHSEDPDLNRRLALEGCQFARADCFASLRRVHAGRCFDRIPERIGTLVRALDTVFNDPRCPVEVLSLREEAYAREYLTWACQEFVQGETHAGQEHLRLALRLNPAFQHAADGNFQASELLRSIVWFSLREGGDHVAPLEAIFDGLPPELAPLHACKTWALGRGYLIRAARESIWDRTERALPLLAQSVALHAPIDEYLLGMLNDQLACIADEYGSAHAVQALERLLSLLKGAGSPAQLRQLASAYWARQAFQDYRQGRRSRVPASVLRAVWHSPARLADRGVLSVLARSLFGASLS